MKESRSSRLETVFKQRSNHLMHIAQSTQDEKVVMTQTYRERMESAAVDRAKRRALFPAAETSRVRRCQRVNVAAQSTVEGSSERRGDRHNSVRQCRCHSTVAAASGFFYRRSATRLRRPATQNRRLMAVGACDWLT